MPFCVLLCPAVIAYGCMAVHGNMVSFLYYGEVEFHFSRPQRVIVFLPSLHQPG